MFFSCDNNKEKEISDIVIKDSLDYYFKIIDGSKIDDSIKIKYNKKALKISEKLKEDSLYFKYHFKTARRFYNLNNDGLYKSVVLKTLDRAIKNKDTLSKAKAYLFLGDYYLKLNKNDSAFYFYDRSEINYVTKNDLSKTNDVRLNKAVLQYYEKDFIGCETNIYRTLSFFQKNDKTLSLNVCYTLLGLCQIETKDFDEADENLKLALFYSNKLDVNTRAVETANNNLGILFFNKQDYSTAIKYYDKVINEDTKKDLFQIYTYAKQNQRYSRFKLGDIQDFEKDYDEILKNFKELNLSPIQPLTQLSEFYESQNNLLKAQEYALEAYKTSREEKLYRDKLIALKQLTNVFPEKSKYYSAEYIKLSDSIATVDKKTQNTFARIEYRIDELSNENLLLAERNKQIIYFSVIVLLLLSMYYFYKWQKQKQLELLLIQEQQKANEQVYSLLLNQQEQMDKVKIQEQKRISQELHDGVLGKLFGARMNLDFINSQQSEEIKNDKQKYIHEIIEVEKQIRQISHDLNDDKRAIINNFQLLLDKFVENHNLLLNLKIDYSFNKKVPWEKVTAEEKINLYRIIQESFQNIHKYSNAKKVTFTFEYLENKLKITILDDGVGFNTKRASKGIGIKNMKDRAKLINAIYKIESELNKGTKTQIILEINPHKEIDL